MHKSVTLEKDNACIDDSEVKIYSFTHRTIYLHLVIAKFLITHAVYKMLENGENS